MFAQAHSNNVVVLAHGASTSSFLSFLDLDMAFDDKSFVDIWASEPTPVRSEEEYTRLLRREHLNFMEVLAGSDSSNGVPMVARAAVEVSCPDGSALKAVKTALYDTLILGYLRGYTDDVRFPVAPLDAALHDAAHDVMKLCIMVMADYIA